MTGADAYRVGSEPGVCGHIRTVLPNRVVQIGLRWIDGERGINHGCVATETVADDRSGTGGLERGPAPSGFWTTSDPDFGPVTVSAEQGNESHLPRFRVLVQRVAEGVAGVALINLWCERIGAFGFYRETADIEV